ncbi:MAG: DUF1622 domain-containing protein [Acidobacteriota bacterium]|nr:DUF1622 domain-containing protein [Acidobacteriota bacterium]
MFFQENLQTLTQPSFFQTAEPTINAAVQWLRLAVESIGAMVIGIGILLAAYQFVAHFKDEQSKNFNRVRLTLGKYLALALEFQVGADILSTAIAPGWEQIGKLGAIVIIRTLLNYFLTKELEHERRRDEPDETSPTNTN